MRIILLILFLDSTLLSAQGDFHFTNHYTQKDGLSNTAIYCIYEDSKGYVWAGTNEGLNRFDGYQFKSFYHTKFDSNSLSHNTVHDILEYQPGLILVATANGLSVFNTALRKFENERITYASLAPGSGTNVLNLLRDKEGNIWINQNGELDVLDSLLNYKYRLTDLEWAKGLKGSLILYEDWQTDAEGKIWLPTDTSGLQVIDLKNKVVYNRTHNPARWPFMEFKHIRALWMNAKGNTVYIAPWGSGIYKYELGNGTMMHQDFGQPLQEESSVNSILPLDDGDLLCNSNGKFFKVNPHTLAFQKIDFPFHIQSANENMPIHAITMVKSNDLRYWIGANEGMFQLERNDQQRELSIATVTGNSNCIDIIVSTNGLIYGLYENGVLIETDPSRKTYSSYYVPLEAGGLLLQMCEDYRKQIWIASSRGVLIFNTVSKKFSRPVSSIGNFSSLFIHAIYCDRDETLWMATRQPFGLYRYTIKEDDLQKMENEPLRQMGVVSEYARISSIVEDEESNLWMRSVVGGGILQYDKKNNAWKLHPSDMQQSTLIGTKGMNALYPDHRGQLWLSTTSGDGLIRYDYWTQQTEQFNREEGIRSDHIFHIGGDKDQLWLTTEYGFTRFDTRDHTMNSQDWAHVTTSFDMVIDTVTREMILGTQGKIIMIPLDEGKKDLPAIVPSIDRIFINNKELYIDPGTTKLKLPYDQKNVTIDFTAPYFRKINKLKFAYFLEGADEGWQYPESVRTAQYAALSPGTYVFQLKASDHDGQWGTPVNAFTFTITPPFWQQAWFLLLLALSLSTLAFVIVKKRVQTIRYESSLKQKVAETEMMALRAQMNPHFIFNSLNSIDALIHNNDKYQATLYLNKFARLIRNVLDSSKQNTVTAEKDIETLRLYIELEQFRSENAFTSHIEIDPKVLREDIRVPPLIIQPYVENAILHGLRNRPDDRGKLNVSLRRSADGLEYIVEDNGVGRKHTMNGHSHEKTSYGMQMSSDRIKIFNQEEQASVRIIDLIENGIPTGTKVEIKLKIT